MVEASKINTTIGEKIMMRNMEEIPTVDLSAANRSEISKQIVKACEDYGFFKVINHGVPKDVILEFEDASSGFFLKPESEKQAAGPANPFGYGKKNIGCNGDVGGVEYLLLPTNHLSVAQLSKLVSIDDPSKFSTAVTAYIEEVRALACELLVLMAEALCVPDTQVFSRLIKDIESDSLLRLNHYPPSEFSYDDDDLQLMSPSYLNSTNSSFGNRVGFGEHSDPQILTLLKSNDVGGLQICIRDGLWVPVTPDPSAFCVNVGDVLQAMTNGRFMSVRHRAVIGSDKRRLSISYFGAPSLNSQITTLPELVKPERASLYMPFTWAEYKKVTYSLRLGDSRLALFKRPKENETLRS